MILRNLVFVLVSIWLVSSCGNKSGNNADNKTSETALDLCNQLRPDSIITIRGLLTIGSDSIMNFEVFDMKNEPSKKIQIIPCSPNLKEYIVRTYTSYLNLKNEYEKFGLSIDGEYLKVDTLQSPPQFLFNFVSLIGNSEAKK